MARFVFKLEGVLRQRKHEEQQRQRDLAEKQLQLAELQRSLQQVQQNVQAANDDLRSNRLLGRLDMSFLAAHRRYLGAMQRQGIGLMQRIALGQRLVDESRIQLGEAAKRRKVIEKLRERQFERWRSQINRRELEELDEIGMQLAYQNLSEESEPAP